MSLHSLQFYNGTICMGNEQVHILILFIYTYVYIYKKLVALHDF